LNKDLLVLSTYMGWLCMVCLLSLLIVIYEHWAKEDTKSHQFQSAIMGSCDFCAFKFYISSKSLRLNLKKYSLNSIPISASFYNFVFDKQCQLGSELAYSIGITCLHFSCIAGFLLTSSTPLQLLELDAYAPNMILH
jgi:hypothetical protein